MDRVPNFCNKYIKTFPKWPYKNFIKRRLLRIKKIKPTKRKVFGILTVHTFISFQLFGFVFEIYQMGTQRKYRQSKFTMLIKKFKTQWL